MSNINGRFFIVVDDLLTPQECKGFIEKLNKEEDLEHVDRGIANYDRNVMIDGAFADVIYKRILPFLPAGTRRCNEYFRFSKYVPGQEFQMHRDGFNQDRFGNRTKYTVNIFLGEDWEGGSTDFYNEDRKLVTKVTPKTGRAGIFDREILHSGAKVTKGIKYLLRTDVME
jgi:prolyl 4-hydroxylase